MSNPFDDEEGEFLILVNDEGQHSLWPVQFDIPEGWGQTGPCGARQACLEWVDGNWTDIRPLSLVRDMESQQRTHRD